MKIELANVASVYSGKDGKCCCGCAGKHTYASAHREWASQNRGYKVEDEDVSDRTVKLIVNKMNKLFEGGATPDYVEQDFVSVVTGARLYVAYFVKKTP